MGKGGTIVQRIDIIDVYDPRILGRAADKGTLFRYIPSVGDPVLLIKADNGYSTNWIDASGSGGVYTASNLGTGEGVFAALVAGDFQFKSLVAGTGITLSSTATEITITNTGGGAGTGDPNTLAYFDGTGALADNVNAIFDETLNSMALLVSPGTINLSGSNSIIFARGDTTGTVTASGIGSFIQGYFQGSSTITASSTGSRVSGFANAGTMTAATGAGASVVGVATTSGSLSATAAGSLASGIATTSGSIIATTPGSMALGAAASSAIVSAGGGGTYGSLAFGGVSDSCIVESTNSGSLSHGGGSGIGSFIRASQQGTHAHGVVSSAGNVIASGLASHAHGNATSGYAITASGRGSFAGGTALTGNLTSSAEASFAYGDLCSVSGNYAQALGFGHTNTSYATLMIGRYGVTTGATSNSWVTTDPVFVIGNGTGVGSEAVGFRVDKDARVTSTAGERNTGIRSTNLDTTLSARTDRVLYVDTSGMGGNITITFPAGEVGTEFWIKDAGGNATMRNILFVASGGDTVEASADITNDRGARHFQFASGTWYILNLP